VLAAALVLTSGWRAVAGLAMTGSAVLLATVIALPGTLGDFLRKLPENVHYMQVEHPYLWDRHVTLKAFWRLLVDGFGAGEMTPLAQRLTVLSLACLGAFLLGMIWKLRPRRDGLSRDRLMAACIVAMPLLMPFYFDYDLLLLAVPAALLAREAAAGDELLDRWLVAAWAALYAWLIVNSTVATATTFNGTVVLLTVLAAMMIRRAARTPAALRVVATPQPMPLRAAA
jgi:hypothetical protein